MRLLVRQCDVVRAASSDWNNPGTILHCTSYVEPQNLTMRMGMRCFMRLTNGFSKKVENHLNMHSVYFVRIHKTLKMIPVMAAGIADTLDDIEWMVGLIDAQAPAPKKRGICKKNDISN